MKTIISDLYSFLITDCSNNNFKNYEACFRMKFFGVNDTLLNIANQNITSAKSKIIENERENFNQINKKHNDLMTKRE